MPGAPSTAITRFDLSMSYSEFSLMANIAKFIGLKALPPLAVALEAAEFRRMNIDSWLTKMEDTRRGADGTYSRDTWEWDTDNYALLEHGVEEPVDDATVEKYGDIVRAEMVAALRAVNRVLQRLEYDIAKALFNTTTFSGNLTFVAGTPYGAETPIPWSNAADADPVADIDNAHEQVNVNSGEDANTFICTKRGYVALIRTQRLESLLKYDAVQVLTAMNRGANENLVADVVSGICELLQIEQILVGRGFQNTQNRGLTASMSRIWDDTMGMLAVVRDDGMEGDLENPLPQLGRTLFTTKNGEPLPGADDAGLGSLLIDEYRDEPIRGSILRPRNKRQIKIFHPQTAQLITALTG